MNDNDLYDHPRIVSPSRRRIPLAAAVALGAVGVMVLLGAVLFSGSLGTKVINPASSRYGRYESPSSLATGRPAVVSWFVNPGQPAYPSVKIELCRGRFFGQRCVTINPDTPNDGAAIVFLPVGLPGGPAAVRITPREQPLGRLLAHASIAGEVDVIAGRRGAAIGPVNVGGGAIFSLTPAGPRVPVNQGGTYEIILPEPSVSKKIEVCWRDGARDRCRILAADATGASAQVTVPGIPQGRAYLKVSERGADGLLTGRVFYQRALLVTPPRLAEQPSDAASGDSSGDSGGGGGSSSSDGPSTQVIPPTADFIPGTSPPADDRTAALRVVDTNHDDLITLDEMISALRGFHAALGKSRGEDGYDPDYDFNNSGAVAVNDLAPLRQLLPRMSEAQRRQLAAFQAIDQNQDYVLTAKEWQDGAAQFTSLLTQGAAKNDDNAAFDLNGDDFLDGLDIDLFRELSRFASSAPSDTLAAANFIVPAEGSTVAAGTQLDIRVQLTETTASQLACQQWLLDGRPLTSADWANGQSPDLSDGPCP